MGKTVSGKAGRQTMGKTVDGGVNRQQCRRVMDAMLRALLEELEVARAAKAQEVGCGVDQVGVDWVAMPGLVSELQEAFVSAWLAEDRAAASAALIILAATCLSLAQDVPFCIPPGRGG